MALFFFAEIRSPIFPLAAIANSDTGVEIGNKALRGRARVAPARRTHWRMGPGAGIRRQTQARRAGRLP